MARAEPAIRPLGPSDTRAALELLDARPIQNVLLHHLVQAGALGRMASFFGCERDGRLDAIMMVGVMGGSSLELREPDVLAPLAAWARSLRPRPRHLTGAEDVMLPFWQEYSKLADPLLWERRERVYVLSRERFRSSCPSGVRIPELRPAIARDLSQVIDNSAQQHREDLKEDRYQIDPGGFRNRHRNELLEGHWWVLETGGEVLFQVHVGPHSPQVIQLGGVFTPVSLRGRGYATRALRALATHLLESYPAVSLFCDESNATACRLYERVGFEHVFYNRSYLLRCPPDTYLPGYL